MRTNTVVLENAGGNAVLRELGVIFGASLFIAVLAQAAVPLPFTPVPFTLQTLGLYLAAAVLGPKRGTMAVAAYLAEGAAGLPVFAAGGFGPACLVGPAGGYLLGFVPAAFIIGLTGAKSGRLAACVSFACGAAALYCAGLVQLGHFVPAGLLLKAGLWSFLPGEIIKIGMAVAIWPGLRKLAGRI
ncbi:MAG: biotin transporter BioY [Elusimicrobiaceae bacterium]|nr:biotin transporter BioY [Elusimicrobiaceae bacterium]